MWIHMLFPLHHINFLPVQLPLQYFLHIFLHVKFLESIGVTIFTPAQLLWIHLPHNTELAFTLKLQTPHRSTLLLDMPSFVMPPLTITMVFPRLTFIPFHFKNLFLRPSCVSLIRTKSSVYSNPLSAPSLANNVTTSTTTWKRKDDSTDPWFIPTLTSNSSDNSESTHIQNPSLMKPKFLAFLSSSLPIPTLFSVLCQQLSQGP